MFLKSLINSLCGPFWDLKQVWHHPSSSPAHQRAVDDPVRQEVPINPLPGLPPPIKTLSAKCQRGQGGNKGLVRLLLFQSGIYLVWSLIASLIPMLGDVENGTGSWNTVIDLLIVWTCSGETGGCYWTDSNTLIHGKKILFFIKRSKANSKGYI